MLCHEVDLVVVDTAFYGHCACLTMTCELCSCHMVIPPSYIVILAVEVLHWQERMQHLLERFYNMKNDSSLQLAHGTLLI